MNFKTTIFLIALLLIAGVTVYFVHQQPAPTTEAPTATKNLLSISQDDVAKISVMPPEWATACSRTQRCRLDNHATNPRQRPIHSPPATWPAKFASCNRTLRSVLMSRPEVDHPNYVVDVNRQKRQKNDP